MSKMKFIIVLGLLGFAVSCSRAEKQAPGNVQIQLPVVEKVSSSSYTAQSDDNPDDDNLEWSSDVPDGLYKDANATKKINCYGIMASGPEPEMQINKCGRQDNTTKLIRYVEGAEYNFKVGKWAGAVYASANATLSLEIPPGPSRNLYLIGFYAQDEASCVDLKVNDADTSKMSRPYVIAKATGINIAPGATVPVSMTMAFDSNLWFDSCDFGDNSQNVLPIATRIEVRKDGFPEQSILMNQQCQHIDISLTDDSGRPGVLASQASNAQFALLNASAAPPITGSSYVSLAQCESNSTLTTAFLIPAGESRVRRWIRTAGTNHLGISTTSPSSFNLKVVQDTTSLGAGVNPLVSVDRQMNSLDSNATQFQVIAPRLVKKGEKYLITVIPRRNSGIFLKKDGTPLPSINISGTNNLKLYNNTDCNGGGAGALTALAAVNSDLAYYTFCAEFDDGVSDIIISDSGTGFYRNIITHETAPNPISATFRVESRGGSDSIQRLRMVGDNQITLPATGDKCYGPFYVMAENEYGAVMLNETAASIPLSMNYSLGTAGTTSPLKIFRAPSNASYLPCNVNDDISSTRTIHLSSGDYAAKFFIQGFSNTEVGIARELEIKNADGMLRTKFKLFVD